MHAAVAALAASHRRERDVRDGAPTHSVGRVMPRQPTIARIDYYFCLQFARAKSTPYFNRIIGALNEECSGVNGK